MKANSRLGLAQPARYLIRVEGRLSDDWSPPVDGLNVTVAHDTDGPPVTTLTGRLTDQAALHGLLACLRDLGLPLLLVHCIDSTRPSP